MNKQYHRYLCTKHAYILFYFPKSSQQVHTNNNNSDPFDPFSDDSQVHEQQQPRYVMTKCIAENKFFSSHPNNQPSSLNQPSGLQTGTSLPPPLTPRRAE
jgi:hypothetical protein